MKRRVDATNMAENGRKICSSCSRGNWRSAAAWVRRKQQAGRSIAIITSSNLLPPHTFEKVRHEVLSTYPPHQSRHCTPQCPLPAPHWWPTWAAMSSPVPACKRLGAEPWLHLEFGLVFWVLGFLYFV